MLFRILSKNTSTYCHIILCNFVYFFQAIQKLQCKYILIRHFNRRTAYDIFSIFNRNFSDLSFIPVSIHLVANICRSTCMENLGIFALSHSLNSIVSYMLFLTSLPFLQRNTNSDHSITVTLSAFFHLLLSQDLNGFLCQWYRSISYLAFLLSYKLYVKKTQ